MRLGSTDTQPNHPAEIMSDAALSQMCIFAQKGMVQPLDQFISFVLKGRSPTGAPSQLCFPEGPFPENEVSPFITAALNGQLKVVKYFLKQHAHVVKIDGCSRVALPHVHRYSYSEADINMHTCSALFVASVNGHLNVIKYLIKSGASVNISECCGVTPLHAALLYNRSFKVVDYLISHGANVNAADKLGHTPLMIASEKGDYMLPLVRYLLKKEANMNRVDAKGYSALHHASGQNNHMVVALLLECGAEPMFQEVPHSPEERSHYVPSPLILAAGSGSGEVARELLKHPKCTPMCESEAYLMLGSTHCEMSRRWFSLTAEGMWARALTIREENKLVFNCLPPNEAYGNREEIKTVGDLEQLSVASSSLYEAYYQSLIIRERCMGYGDQKLLRYLYQRGRVFMNRHKYDDAERLLIRATEMVLHVLKTKKIYGKALFFSGARQDVLQVGSYIEHSYEWVQRLLKEDYVPDFVRYLKLVIELLAVLMEPDQNQNVVDDRALLCAIFSLFATWLQTSEAVDVDGTPLGSVDCEEIGYSFVTRHLHTLSDSSLLHLALSEYYHLKRQTIYPSLKDISRLTASLLRWGAHKVVNEPTPEGERPLHLAAHLANSEGQSPIPVLLQYGAHLDAVGTDGRAAQDLCTSEELKALLFPSVPLPLSCQASRFLVSNSTPYRTMDLPPHIKQFIELHDKATVLGTEHSHLYK